MKFVSPFTLSVLILPMIGFIATSSDAQQRPSRGVVVTINNRAPNNGTFQTPVWIGFHKGNFDIYDRNEPANSLPISGSTALERLAEDGSTGPISEDFSIVSRTGVQSTITSNVPDQPVLAPRNRVSRLFRLNPRENRFFSYASMVIPSNDAFVANGNPRAHRVFSNAGRFVASNFTVTGDQVLDAGTEVNDELPENTAFFGQAAPDTGETEDGVIGSHMGFAEAGSGGILDDPMFANADFLEDGYEAMTIRFQSININAANRFGGIVDATQEIPEPDVDGIPMGVITTRTNARNNRLSFLVAITGLSGRPTAAHLHVGLAGQTGPVVADLVENGTLISFRGQTFLFGEIRGDDVVGPLDTDEDSISFDNLLAELATRGIYVNVHTERNPAGEVRGQVFFQR